MAGTMMVPPPTPIIPERKPVKAPARRRVRPWATSPRTRPTGAR